MPRLRRDRGVAHRARAVDVRGLWTSGVGDRGHHFPGDPYSVVRLVPGDLVGGQPKKWRQRAGPTARARLGQLPHGVDVAAQAATRDGAAWPGPGVGGGRGGRDPRGRARGGRRPPTPGKKALVVIAAEVRGRAIGRIRMQRVADASADSLLTFVQHAVQPGSVVITDGLQSYRRLPKRGYRHDRRVLLGRGESARRSCLASTGSRRSSSAGSWVRIRAASVASISTITSTSSPFGSIDEPHAIAGSSSIGSWNRPWRWVPFPTRRWSRVSVVGRRNATTTGSRDLSKGNTPMGACYRIRGIFTLIVYTI